MDYRATLCQALSLPTNATDAQIAARCVAVLGAMLSGAPTEVKSFSAQGRHGTYSPDAEVARQMGVSHEALVLYGAKTRA